MNQLKVKPTWLKATKALSDAECGRLFRGALKYAFSGEAPVLTGNERIVWEQVMDDIDQQRKRSDHQSEVNMRNAANRYESLRIATNRCEEKETPSSPPEPPVITPKKETKKTLSKERAKESLLSPALQEALTAFKEMRQKMRKPMTPLAVDLLIDKLRKLAPGDEQKQVAMLMQSIENGWTGVYELKQEPVKKIPSKWEDAYNKWHPACEREEHSSIEEIKLDLSELDPDKIEAIF